MRVAAIQMTSGPEVAANLDEARGLLDEAAARGAELAVLPENFAFMGLRDVDKRAVAEADGDGPIQGFLATTALRLRMTIVGGTVPLRAGALTGAWPPLPWFMGRTAVAVGATTKFICSMSTFRGAPSRIASQRM